MARFKRLMCNLLLVLFVGIVLALALLGAPAALAKKLVADRRSAGVQVLLRTSLAGVLVLFAAG